MILTSTVSHNNIVRSFTATHHSALHKYTNTPCELQILSSLPPFSTFVFVCSACILPKKNK
eukprot:m.88619 g.88619  ORF g.88619 m.88619 type:complete len:61 (+) comp13631_c0_seq1:929-1111(+)